MWQSEQRHLKIYQPPVLPEEWNLSKYQRRTAIARSIRDATLPYLQIAR
jgi:hypothetical protein